MVGAVMVPEVEVDPSVDAAYVRLQDGVVARTQQLDGARLIDLDRSGEPLGVEFLNVSRGVRLEGLPSREAIEMCLRERHIAPVTPSSRASTAQSVESARHGRGHDIAAWSGFPVVLIAFAVGCVRWIWSHRHDIGAALRR